MHESIITFDTNQKPKEIKKLEAGLHTHALSNCPVDSDVFYVPSGKPLVPEILVTGEHVMYIVMTDGKIERRERCQGN
jgi:hypothetical protein